jgi:hypothetical protein
MEYKLGDGIERSPADAASQKPKTSGTVPERYSRGPADSRPRNARGDARGARREVPEYASAL